MCKEKRGKKLLFVQILLWFELSGCLICCNVTLGHKFAPKYTSGHYKFSETKKKEIKFVKSKIPYKHMTKVS